MARFLITGAGGFLGSALLRRLEREGHERLAVVRRESVARRLEREHAGTRVEAIDLLDPTLPDVLAAWAPNVVIHAAGGRVSGSPVGFRENFATNVAPTLELVEAFQSVPLGAFVLASTGEVYGDQGGPFVESMSPRPTTEYAASKVAAETIVMAAHRRRGFAGIVARLGVVYGPVLEPGSARNMMIPQLVESARSGRAFPMTRGEQTRDFLYVDDAARALVELGLSERARGMIVNVGAGVSHPVRDVARKMLAELGDPVRLELGAVPYGPREIMDYRLDTTLLRSLTGFEPAWSLEAGLRETARAR